MTALPNNSVGITPEEQQAVVKERLQQMGVPLTDPVSLMPGQPGSVQANSSMEVPDTAVGTDLDDAQQNTKEAKAAVEHWTTVLQQPGLTPKQGQAANRELTKQRGGLLQSARTQADLSSPKTIDPRKHANQDMLPGEVWRNPNRGAEQQRIVILPGSGQMVMVDKDTGWAVQLTGDQAKLAIASADVARGQQIKQEEADNARVAYTRDSEALKYAIQLNGQTNDVLLDSRFSGLDAVAGYDPELADDLAEFYKSAEDFVHSMSPQEYEDFLVSGESHLQEIHKGKYDTDTGGNAAARKRLKALMDEAKRERIKEAEDRVAFQRRQLEPQAENIEAQIIAKRKRISDLQQEMEDLQTGDNALVPEVHTARIEWITKEIDRLSTHNGSATDDSLETLEKRGAELRHQDLLLQNQRVMASLIAEKDLNKIAEEDPRRAYSLSGPFFRVIQAVADVIGIDVQGAEFAESLTDPSFYEKFVARCRNYAYEIGMARNPGDVEHWAAAIDSQIAFTTEQREQMDLYAQAKAKKEKDDLLRQLNEPSPEEQGGVGDKPLPQQVNAPAPATAGESVAFDPSNTEWLTDSNITDSMMEFAGPIPSLGINDISYRSKIVEWMNENDIPDTQIDEITSFILRATADTTP